MGRFTFERKITLGNVISIVIMVFGGVGFLITNESRLKEVETRVTSVETSLRSGESTARDTDARTTSKIDSLTRDMNDVKVTMRGVQTAVEFLVEAERRRAR